jgi:hypothetical protein
VLTTIDPAPLGPAFQAGALADNGGPVETIAIKIGGAAHDAGDAGELPQDSEDLDGDGNTTEDLPFDARGETRMFGAGLDVGAYEIQNTPPVQVANTGLALDEGASATIITAQLDYNDLDEPPTSVTYTITGAVAIGTLLLSGVARGLGSTFTQDDIDHNRLTYSHDGSEPTATSFGFSVTDGVNPAITGQSFAININPHTHLFGTPDDDAFDAPPGKVRIDALGGFGDTITFNFRLTDATVRYVGNIVIIDGPSSHTVLTGFERYVFTDGTVDNNDGSPLVDDLFYYSKYHDVWNAHADADAHYNSTGWHENRDPSYFFSTSTYLSANPDVADGAGNPLTHFHDNGWQEGRVPSIHFDPQQYLSANPEVAAAHVDPLEHYLLFGHQEGRAPFAPSELIAANGFDYVWYLSHNPDVAAANIDAFAHFMTVGWTEGRNPNALFDVSGYLATYADVAAAHVNPLTHFNTFGWHEGRDPSVAFDTTSYLAAYPDVAASKVNPLTHFLQFGIHEGRSPFADGVWG